MIDLHTWLVLTNHYNCSKHDFKNQEELVSIFSLSSRQENLLISPISFRMCFNVFLLDSVPLILLCF